MKKVIITIIVIIILACAGYFAFPYFSSWFSGSKTLDEKIVVTSPIKDSEISSPLRISGRARGTWFFEGSFPVTLLDQYKNTIAEGAMASQGEWMTEDFVPFIGTLQFNNYIKGTKGTLVLKKDNPSGLPENDDSIEIPIVFK